MKKVFKLVITILLVVIIIGCNNKVNFYDLDPPSLLFYSFINENFLIQFNEPIQSLDFILNQKNLFLKNSFPKANIFLSVEIFDKYEKNNLKIIPKDTSGNSSVIELNIFSNPEPALLSIKELRLRYSKKLDQMIVFNVEKEGNLAGLNLIIFFGGKKEIFTFEKCFVRKNESLFLNFLYEKDKETIRIIDFSKNRNIKNLINKHLSQSSSLIMLTDHNNKLMDYILYYNSKNNSLDKLKGGKNFKAYREILEKYGITEPVYSDINGNTSKNTIIKYKKGYIIKNVSK